MKSDFSIYANGVPSFSPILDGTALRFISSTAPVPRVGLIAFSQPWAGGHKPVGLMDSNTNGISSFLSLSSPYANGVPSSSPGLRGTRYPGTPAAHEFLPQRGCGLCVSSRTLETERTETLTALDGFLTGLGDLK